MDVAQSATGETEAIAGTLLVRARSEFIEMPGLQLTAAQAARLWALDRMTSEQLLDRLVAAGFLWRNRAGTYLRVSKA